MNARARRKAGQSTVALSNVSTKWHAKDPCCDKLSADCSTVIAGWQTALDEIHRVASTCRCFCRCCADHWSQHVVPAILRLVPGRLQEATWHSNTLNHVFDHPPNALLLKISRKTTECRRRNIPLLFAELAFLLIVVFAMQGL